MKKLILAILTLFSLGSLAQNQNTGVRTKKQLKSLAINAVNEYLGDFVDFDTYKKYFYINDSKSYGVFHLPFDNMDTPLFNKDMVEGFAVEVIFYSPLYYTDYTMKVDQNFKVIETITFQGDNYTKQYLRSLSNLAKSIENNSVLKSEDVRDWVRNEYPGKRWMHPTMLQYQYPPYNFYYEVFQDDCSPCKSLHIATDTLKILDEKVNPLRAKTSRLGS